MALVTGDIDKRSIIISRIRPNHTARSFLTGQPNPVIETADWKHSTIGKRYGWRDGDQPLLKPRHMSVGEIQRLCN